MLQFQVINENIIMQKKDTLTQWTFKSPLEHYGAKHIWISL